MDRRPFVVAGNWKMHLEQENGLRLAEAIIKQADQVPHAHLILFPPYIHLSVIQALVLAYGKPHVGMGAQNMHHETQGAFTGEVSGPMLRSAGCGYVLVGHSERRQLFGETSAWLAQKVKKALVEGLVPVYCCGETLQERQAGKTAEVIAAQIQKGLFHLSAREMGRTMVAYEPVWAIGTGETASPNQAQEVHAQIRGLIGEQYGHQLAARIQLLYGGSVKPNNAESLFAQVDIDGGLVGSASLQAEHFLDIAKAGAVNHTE